MIGRRTDACSMSGTGRVLIAIVWPEGSEPGVTAFGAAGEKLDYLDPALFGDG